MIALLIDNIRRRWAEWRDRDAIGLIEVEVERRWGIRRWRS
jgi:hypothetical protein